MQNPEYFLRRMGVYRNFSAGVVSFANITFRMVGGVLGGLPPESVSFFTAIERFLWLWMEVPGGWIADRIGRLKTAIIGYSLVLIANIAMYLAYLSHIHWVGGNPFFYLAVMGVLIGFGGPLISASAESYYQELYEAAIRRERRDPAAIERSFSESQKYGRALPLIYVLFSFVTLFVCHRTVGAGHSFLLFILLDGLLIGFLTRDLRSFGDPKIQEGESLGLRETLSLLLQPRIGFSSALSILTWLYIYLIGFFALLSLGRELGVESADGSLVFWILTTAMAIGNQGFAPWLSGIILPRWSSSFSILGYLYTAFLALLALSIPVLFVAGSELDTLWLCVGFVLFCTFSGVPQAAIQLSSNNIALQGQNQRNYATILSVKLMPPQIFIFALGATLTAYYGGAPTILELMWAVILISLVGIGLLLLKGRSPSLDLGTSIRRM